MRPGLTARRARRQLEHAGDPDPAVERADAELRLAQVERDPRRLAVAAQVDRVALGADQRQPDAERREQRRGRRAGGDHDAAGVDAPRRRRASAASRRPSAGASARHGGAFADLDATRAQRARRARRSATAAGRGGRRSVCSAAPTASLRAGSSSRACARVELRQRALEPGADELVEERREPARAPCARGRRSACRSRGSRTRCPRRRRRRTARASCGSARPARARRGGSARDCSCGGTATASAATRCRASGG